jgi:hypothetical protein
MSAFDPKRTLAPVVPVATSARFGSNLAEICQQHRGDKRKSQTFRQLDSLSEQIDLGI